MDRWIGAWLPLPWKLALVLALVWPPIGAVIILTTSAMGEPLPMPWRLFRTILTYAAYVIIITTLVKLASRR